MRDPIVTDSQLDRLETLLEDASFEEAMGLDELQGYLCGALAGPVPIPERERLIEILGSEAALDSEAGQEAAPLIARVTEELHLGLSNRDEPLILYLYPESEEEDAESDYEPWCMAYLHALDTASEDWFDAITDEEEMEWLDERLFPLMVLTGEAETAAREHGEEWPEGDELAELHQNAKEDLARAVSEIYLFWRARRSGQTLRHEGEKTGRNDPCTCGSGKKYKQCCGSAA